MAPARAVEGGVLPLRPNESDRLTPTANRFADTLLVPRKRSSRPSTARTRVVASPPVVPPGDRLFVLSVPYLERALAAQHGAKWDPFLRATVFVGPSLPSNLQPYGSPPFSWERWQEDDLNGTPGAIPRPQAGLTPRPHQKEAASAIANAARIGARGFLLADEVGLGKTLSALEGVRALRQHRSVRNLLIVTPLAVVPHWRRSVADSGFDAEGIRVCVINYDRLKNLLSVPSSAETAKRTRTKNKRIAKEGTSLISWDVVIFDESHKIRNPESQRRAAAERLAQYSASRSDAPFVIWASATAGQSPVEISYLWPLLAQLTKSPANSFRNFGPWLQEHGFHVNHEPRFDRWTWTDDAAERQRDIAHMRSLIFDRKTPVALRRVPEDIAGWPEIVRTLLPVDLAPDEYRLYNEAWTAFRKEMRLARKGKDPKAGMVARLRFRQKASLLRVAGTVDFALDLLENGHQVAISVQFLETLDHIAKGIEKAGVAVATLDGRNPRGREDERLRFQRGEAKVALFTPVEGFSLHSQELLSQGQRATRAPRSTIIHDARFSGIEAIQIEGRCHRDGQAANVYYAFGASTVEEQIVRTLLARVEATKALVGDDTATLRALEAILDGD